MKTNDIKALHQKKIDELKQLLEETQKELVQAKLELAASKLNDTSKPARLAKDVARIKTILHQKVLEQKAQAKAEIQTQQETETKE